VSVVAVSACVPESAAPVSFVEVSATAVSPVDVSPLVVSALPLSATDPESVGDGVSVLSVHAAEAASSAKVETAMQRERREWLMRRAPSHRVATNA
jgi:hypothetical protein